MKIAGMGYNSKRVNLLNNSLRIWAEKYNSKRAYTRGLSDKILYEKVMPRISISGSVIDGKSKKIDGKWVFVNARKLPQEAENYITQKEQEIEILRKQISDYLNEHFLEWDFVSIEEVLEFRAKNEIDKEQEQKYQAHVRNVIKQLDMNEKELQEQNELPRKTAI